MKTDSLYYIMDYSGNYYRTDMSDQLVTTSEKDATVFTFTQANSRIGTGKKASFYCMIPIDEKSESEEVEEEMSPIKELLYDEVCEQVEKNALSYDLSEMDWTEYLTHFTYIVSGLKDYRDNLAKKHSDIDQKICDILHYIELCETADDEAIDLVELLRVCRENRREIKDELQRIEYFQSQLGTNANLIKANQALKSMKGLENRKYKPRKYEELFENCVMKKKHLQKDVLCSKQIRQESEKKDFDCRVIYEEESEEVVEERIYTPFDGKENDWLSFAKQQAEFYRHAGQYIKNIQIDIHEIEEEIEDVLLKTEDANCNVAQGYKVFKRLKELRLEKKAKVEELHCLYALTDYIDCNALADTCEDNLAEVEGIVGIKDARNLDDNQVEDSMCSKVG